MSIDDRDATLEGIDEKKIKQAISDTLASKIADGKIRLKNDDERQKIQDGAERFYRDFAHKQIWLSDGRYVYFIPGSDELKRSGNLDAWAVYCIHQVTSNQTASGGKVCYRSYWEDKDKTIPLLEKIIQEENVFPSIRKNDPKRDAVVFVGKSFDGKRTEIVTRLDQYGNLWADLSEISFLIRGKSKENKKNPPLMSLAEVVETVAQHQATGISPSTGININASDDLSSGDWKKSGRGSVDLASQLDPALEDNMIEALLAPVKSANGDLAALLEGGALKYLTDNGFPDVGNNVARYLVMEARDRLRGIMLKQSRKQAFDNFRQMDPLFDFIAEFAGNGESMVINPGEKYVDSDVSGILQIENLPVAGDFL